MVEPTIYIVVIEDDSVFRENLVRLINQIPGMACIHSFSAATHFWASEPQSHNDLYWVDINLPGGSGIELIRKLKKKNQDRLCIICSLYDDDQHVFDALGAGADGYLLKNVSPEQMIVAIRELLGGGAPMSPYIARKLINSFKVQPTKPVYNLSAREEEVLQHIAKGLLYKEVAENMHISIETVKKHLRSVYGKLQVQNRTEAVVKYLSSQ